MKNSSETLFIFIFCVCVVIQHVNRLEITPDKRYLAAACNPHIRLFDVNSNSPQPVINYSLFFYLCGFGLLMLCLNDLDLDRVIVVCFR